MRLLGVSAAVEGEEVGCIDLLGAMALLHPAPGARARRPHAPGKRAHTGPTHPPFVPRLASHCRLSQHARGWFNV